jgi:serine/threonine protein phosphatase PrpC
VLYFYRHKADAVSEEAVAERQDDSETAAEEVEKIIQQQRLPTRHAPALSSSFLRPNSSNGNGGSANSVNILAQSPRIPKAKTHLWEKRLGLVFVGSVRTAEGEYGKHALELSSLEPDNDDCLILRARNAEEMNEWFFQLHRSIEVFIKNIMTTTLWHDVGEMIVPSSGSPVWLSPRLRPKESSVPLLSHGHGRSRRHRERDTGSDDVIPPVLPDETLSQTPLRVTTTLPFMPHEQVEDLRNHNSISPSVDLRPATPVFDLEDDFLPPEQTAPTPPESEHPPAPRSGKYIPPHLRQRESGTRAYIPPHLRRKHTANMTNGAACVAGDNAPAPSTATTHTVPPIEEFSPGEHVQVGVSSAGSGPPTIERPIPLTKSLVLGGCADPDHVQGSILDDRFIPRKASKLYRTTVKPFGWTQSSRWEIGAVSECGARDSNEDAYLVVADLWEAFASIESSRNSLEELNLTDAPAIFCVFDGHCGDQAARYAAEKFIYYLYEASKNAKQPGGQQLASEHVEDLIRRALVRLDADFCELCIQDGRTWEAGTTALIAALLDDDLVVANLGDARGVLSRSVEAPLNSDEYDRDFEPTSLSESNVWLRLDSEPDTETGSSDDTGANVAQHCVYKYVTRTHSPSRPDERARIERSNGWVTTEQEIPVSQALRLDLHDELARDILNRALAQEDGGAAAPHRMIQISRVCGELAVSRALGDRDFKTNYSSASSWVGAVFLPYPEGHSRSFTGDLVINVPEVQAIRVRPAGATNEFLLLACDGLWDVMDADDAVRVTRQLLLEEKMPVCEAAGRLAKLAMHLGSSDNISIIIVSFVS